jgi:hypothetical protein
MNQRLKMKRLFVVACGCILLLSSAQASAADARRPGNKHYWLSASSSRIGSDDSFGGLGTGGGGTLTGIYYGRGKTVVGLRTGATYADTVAESFACSVFAGECVASYREAGLLVGFFGDHHKQFWMAAGVARVESIRQDGKRSELTVGLPFEVAYSPSTSIAGLDLRIAGNLNSAQSDAALYFGLRFGNLD